MVTIKSKREIELMRNACKVVAILYEELEKKIKPGMTTLEVDKLAADINKQKASLSPSALQNKNIELNKKSVELERLQNDLTAELQNEQAKKLDEIAKDLDPVLLDYAKEKGLDIVFIKHPAFMAYTSQGVDVTGDIISRYDIKWSKKGTK